MLRAFKAGVPSREQKRMFKGAAGTSHGEVSRLWQKEGERCIEQLRERDLGKADYVVLMLDGIGLGDDLCAVVALGITVEGEKHILDFQIGASENLGVFSDLLNRLEARGFNPKRRLLAVTDGFKALRKGIRKKWPEAIIQRCLIHKVRNIKSYLSYRHHGELDRLFKRLRRAGGLEAAEEVVAELKTFLKGKNAQALASLLLRRLNIENPMRLTNGHKEAQKARKLSGSGLSVSCAFSWLSSQHLAAASIEEAGDELLAVHGLEAPSTLNTTLLNTNCIENPFRNVRAKTRRVSRWRPETDMASKWLAYALLEAERGFRRINHCKDMKQPAKILQSISPPPPEEGEKASPSRSTLDQKPATDYKP